MIKKIIAALLLLALTGCAVGPNYHRPDVAVAPAWKEQAPWRVASPQDAIPKGTWWSIFGDDELSQYEAQAITANQTIEIARNQLQQARASVRITQSGLANAQYQASAANLENVRLVMTSELAADYFNLRELDAEIGVVDAAVEYQEKALVVVKNRHDGGVASGLDLNQQETLLNATRTQARLLRRQRAQFEHAIAALVGVPASTFTVPAKPLSLAPPVVPTGVPSDVLERRPDVAQAERQMASFNAQIGVAKSAYYPSIGIFGGGGFENSALGKILNGPSGFWAVGANVAESLLSGGKRKAQVDFATSAYGSGVANYRQTVLTAFQEVEDGLSGLNVLSQAAESQDQAVAAAQRALKIANERYVGGLVTYLDVVTAEQTLLDNQRLAAQILGQRLVTSVALIKALGGGWDASSLQAIHVNTTLKQAVEP